MEVKIIIVNYKGFLDTLECLESLSKLDYEDFQVFIVDNSPDLVSFDIFRQWCDNVYEKPIKTIFPEHVYPLESTKCNSLFIDEDQLFDSKKINERFVFIKANKNLGFAAANNIAISYIKKYQTYSWIWLLNNDTIVPNQTLKNFQEYVSNCEFDERQGMVGNSLYYYEKQNRVQGIGGSYNKFLGYSRHIKCDELIVDNIGAIFRENVDYIMGASMFLSKNFIERVGLMSEQYFLYFEELDWVTRAKRLGIKIGFAPKCGIYHKEGASIGSSDISTTKTQFADYYGIKNKILYTRKFYPYLLPIIYGSLIISILLRMFRKQPDRALMILKIMCNIPQYKAIDNS